MNKAILNYWIDAGLAVTFLASGITGILKFPRLLPNLGISYNSLPMRTLSWLHDWSGIAMIALVFVHLALHWKWIVCMSKRIFGRKSKKCDTE